MTRLSFSLDDDRYRRLEETARRIGATPVDGGTYRRRRILGERDQRPRRVAERKAQAGRGEDGPLIRPRVRRCVGQVDPTHRAMLEEFLGLCPRGGFGADAACGTGKYWHLILEGGFRLAGVDQSKNMLLKANGKFPGIPLDKAALQDLAYTNVYDGIICMDAMEYVPPRNGLSCSATSTGRCGRAANLTFTVELAEATELREAYIAAKALKLPVVEGEWAYEGGYHYYPGIEEVKGADGGRGVYPNGREYGRWIRALCDGEDVTHEAITLLVEEANIRGAAILGDDASVEITHIAENSQQARPGTLFVAVRGSVHDGHKFLADALKRGAIAVAGERWKGRRATRKRAICARARRQVGGGRAICCVLRRSFAQAPGGRRDRDRRQDHHVHIDTLDPAGGGQAGRADIDHQGRNRRAIIRHGLPRHHA